MRTTMNVDDELVAKASELTGVQERTALVRMGLEALIAQKRPSAWPSSAARRSGCAATPRRRARS